MTLGKQLDDARMIRVMRIGMDRSVELLRNGCELQPDKQDQAD